MLKSTKSILGYKISALDDDIGRVRDFYFNEMDWTIRYLIADTGNWMSENLVLISTNALDEPDWFSKRFSILLTKREIENSPPVSKHAPISAIKEKELRQYYRWPAYWPPVEMQTGAKIQDNITKSRSHLRSIDEVLEYHIQARDGKSGYVRDFIIDDYTWAIRYLVIDTNPWLPGKNVIIAPERISNIDWDHKQVIVAMDKNEIKECPHYDPMQPVNQEEETRYYDYYGRPQM